jgi:hypothetical protein
LFLFKKATAAILVTFVTIYALFSLITNLTGNWTNDTTACSASKYCEYKLFASD